MNKPQLCLAFSVSIALLQANLLQATAAPAGQPIWGKLSGSQAAKTAHVATSKTAAKVSHANVAKKSPALSAHGVAASGVNGQVVLFLGKGKDAGSKAPAAALTIHSSLPELAAAEPQTLLAMGNETPAAPAVVSDASGAAAPSESKESSKQLLAQLAPDQIIAQETNTTPIPPVVSGTVDLEEFKPSNSIELKVSQSRTFKLRNKIIRTSISDPSIAEPVVVAENQMVLLGKAPGGATLVLWDDAGNSVALDVKVNRDFASLQSMLREVDPRIILKAFSVGGGDRVVLLGDVDHTESVIKALAVSNAFMDDRGINITVANSRVLGQRLGEQGGSAGGGGQQAGQLSAIGTVDRYTFFGNQNNNISKAQTIVSDGGRVTSLIRVRKTPLIVLHCTFMEMNSQAARELGVQLGLNFSSQSFSFSMGGQQGAANNGYLTSLPGVNGTFGNGLNPGPYGGQFGGPYGFNFGVAPAVGLAGFSAAGAPGVNTIPALAGLFGGVAPTLLVPPGRTPTFGDVTAPVNFIGGDIPGNILGLGQGIPATAPALLAQSNLFGIPGGAAFTNGTLANMFNAITNFASGERTRWSLNPSVQGIISHSRARVLAEPTLVTISGERAAFLAGGEIPILQSIATAGTAAQSVVFEPFGLRINMIPVLLENGTINLQISPEERLLNINLGFNVPGSGSLIPGFTTRKTQTTVEMKPGQELFIAGLVSANHGRELTKTPILGEVPVLGALYRSKAFNKNESELVVAVRPEIILPGTPGQLRLPEEISKVEGPRDTNILQVEPTVLDERYWRAGRAEKSLQLPGTLPPGAPIPDNK